MSQSGESESWKRNHDSETNEGSNRVRVVRDVGVRVNGKRSDASRDVDEGALVVMGAREQRSLRTRVRFHWRNGDVRSDRLRSYCFFRHNVHDARSIRGSRDYVRER